MTPLRLRAALTLCALLCCAPTARADGGAFGIGAVAGEPIGLSAQVRLGAPRLGSAVNVAVGLQLLEDNDLYAHADYIVLLAELVRTPSVSLPLYAGGGLFFSDSAGSRLGARLPLGLQLDLRRTRVHLFAEVALRISVVDDFGAGVGGAGGVRYFF